MKKKILITFLVVFVLAILFVPIPTGQYKDGGTRMYTALTYKVVKWRVLLSKENTCYEKTSVYILPDNFKSYKELWAKEKQSKNMSEYTKSTR